MPSTNVQARLHENGLNIVLRSLMASRPFLFNYGTRYFRDQLDRFCEKIQPLPAWAPGVARMTVEPPLLVPGTAGQVALDYCFQITRLALDFHPAGLASLPPELPLGPHEAALSAELAGAIVCPETAAVDAFADLIAHPPPATGDEHREEEEPPPTILPPGALDCFRLVVTATAAVERKSYEEIDADGNIEQREELGLTLRGFEIEDISPDGLESNLECLVATIVRLGLLPRIRLSLEAIVLDLGGYLSAIVTMPDDPLIQNDRLIVSLLVNVP